MDETHNAWRRQLHRMNLEAMQRGWLVTDDADPSWRGISPDAPEQFRELYAGLTSAGYANGWL